MQEKLYRVNIIIQEYHEEGFWNVIDKSEMAQGKKELIESFDNISQNCKSYIEKRLK